MRPRSLIRFTAATLAAGLLAVTGCATSTPDGAQSAAGVAMREVSPAGATALPAVVGATRGLGAALLADAPREGNVVTSPASLAVALAMLTDGARGATLADLERVLGSSDESRRDAFAALVGAMLALDGDPAVATADELPDQPIVHLASQVVLDEGYQVSPDYLTALADGFGAGVARAELGSEAGKQVLSQWVEHHTGGLIKESAIVPDDDLRLVLQNAVLLAARWKVPFNHSGTTGRPFTLGDGSVVETDTMANLGSYQVAGFQGWSAIRLAYTGETLYADFLLPPQGSDPSEVTPAVLDGLAAALGKATPERVELTMPTLDLQPEPLQLVASLESLGLGSTLCGSAQLDFSGIGPEGPCISQAVQQAVLRVDEEGTLAAAVTEIGMAGTAAPAPATPFALDRPYAVVITHAATGWPLFLAAVRDPRH